MKKKFKVNNPEFIDSVIVNDQTFFFYRDCLRTLATSIFEWTNLPDSMNAEYLEKCLYYFGSACFLYDSKFGFINTNCSSGGQINIYGYPNAFNCYSYGYQTFRILYTGLKNQSELKDTKQCVLVMNNIDRTPTQLGIEQFAYRLYDAQRTCDVNVRAQKTPVVLIGTDKQRLTLENLWSQFDGNKPLIIGEKDVLQVENMKALRTEAPFVADKIQKYKKEIWNEMLMWLGINNIQTEKAERLVTEEANANNECTNLFLQSRLYLRQKACKQFNDLFGFTGTEQEIGVRVRSDLKNIIKNMESIVMDYIDDGTVTTVEENIDNIVEGNEVKKNE